MAKQFAGEFQKIDLIKSILEPHSSSVEVGIGDDAAVVESPKTKLLLCTDAMVEGVHFDLRYVRPDELGHRSLAACISDIAAMNGHPLYALYSLALPSTLPDAFLESFYRGAKKLATELGIQIVGGDLTKSPAGIFIDVSAVGKTDRPITRAGAEPGDLIAISGYPGLAAAGLNALQTRPRDEVGDELLTAHLRPRPRFDLVPNLEATSMIDISDGLSSELNHLAFASNTGFEIMADLLPIHPAVLKEAGSRERAFEWILGGGEDYELLVTCKAPPPGFTVIGKVLAGPAYVEIVESSGARQTLVSNGYNHFLANLPEPFQGATPTRR